MTGVAARKQARRFFGTMGAAMRSTSRRMETGRTEPIETLIRRVHGFPEDRCAGLTRELLAR